jgi:hypothetical protein
MLAIAFETDVAQHDHLVIALDLLEGPLQHGHRVFLVAAEPLAVGAGHPAGCVEQALAVRVVASPAQQGAHRFLGLGGGRAFDRLSIGFDQGHRVDLVHSLPLKSRRLPIVPLRGSNSSIKACVVTVTDDVG